MKKLYFEGMIAMEERSLRITGADNTDEIYETKEICAAN